MAPPLTSSLLFLFLATTTLMAATVMIRGEGTPPPPPSNSSSKEEAAEASFEGIGVNWGTQSTHPLTPAIVVQMLKDNGIRKVKLFDADEWTVSSLAGSGIETTVAIPNDQLKRIAKSYDEAKEWVKRNVTRYNFNGGVNIKYVAVGNEPFLKSYNGSFMKTTFPALQNIQKALDEAGLHDKIKATIPLNADVYESPSDDPLPSAGNFRSDIRDLMVQIVKFLHSNGSPFMVNIYPFLSLYQNPNFPQNFAFFNGGSSPINDKGLNYENVFDANFDTLVWSLKKAGVGDMSIVVGEVGWPTDADKNGNIPSAHKFYTGLLKKLASDKGTPLRPGHIEVYLFGLIDEDAKSIAPGNFERHWGIFSYDGKPKFPMDLTGHGNEKYLVGAKKVEYLPKQWCVLDPSKKNRTLVGENVDYACTFADCTALGYGSSCNQLDIVGNASYAFNMYYQTQDQSVEACDFQGLAMITTQNVSQGTCLFPVQIVSASGRNSVISFVVLLGSAISFLLLI